MNAMAQTTTGRTKAPANDRRTLAKRAVAKLTAGGMTLEGIASELSVSFMSVLRWRDGKSGPYPAVLKRLQELAASKNPSPKTR